MREVDAEVAEKVMNWTAVTLQPYPAKHRSTWEGVPPGRTRPVKVPAYSTDLSAAWQVVEKVNEMAGDVHIYVTADGYSVHIHEDGVDEKVWRVSVDPREGGVELAICLAALQVVDNPEAL